MLKVSTKIKKYAILLCLIKMYRKIILILINPYLSISLWTIVYLSGQECLKILTSLFRSKDEAEDCA